MDRHHQLRSVLATLTKTKGGATRERWQGSAAKGGHRRPGTSFPEIFALASPPFSAEGSFRGRKPSLGYMSSWQ